MTCHDLSTGRRALQKDQNFVLKWDTSNRMIARVNNARARPTGPHRRILVFPFYIGCISRISRGISCISGYISHTAYSAPDIAYIAYIGPYIAYIGPYISYIARISGISQLYRIYRVYRRVYRMYIAYIDVNIAYIARISLSKLRLKLLV